MPIPEWIPKATMAMEEGNIVGWRKGQGEDVVKDEILFEMETDKVIVEVPAPASGTLLRIEVAKGLARLDRPVGWIGRTGEAIPEMPAAAPNIAQVPPIPSAVPGVSRSAVSATPAARRRARELGIDIGSVSGTGPGGRITEADVDSARGRA